MPSRYLNNVDPLSLEPSATIPCIGQYSTKCKLVQNTTIFLCKQVDIVIFGLRKKTPTKNIVPIVVLSSHLHFASRLCIECSYPSKLGNQLFRLWPAVRLSAEPLTERMMRIVNGNRSQRDFNQNTTNFIHQNKFDKIPSGNDGPSYLGPLC